MHLNSDEKVEIFEKYGKGKTHLTEHLRANHKDYTTARALKALVGKRRRLLDYLIRKDINRYRAIIAQKELGIRK
ncbi:30S ribosomal protein S15 [Duncaniella muris]|uniref:30S ribosomal protein S15 n=1 Tax=Duncaniella muris TaxID=2094150 RepID=UPI002602074D|nr:30S ribosomal protein S15 [Duncaniella muris]